MVEELSKKVESQEVTIDQLKETERKWENIKAACSDLEEEASNLREDLMLEQKKREQTEYEYSKLHEQYIKLDAELENHKNWLKIAGDELNTKQKENKHLWALISLKAEEMNA